MWRFLIACLLLTGCGRDAVVSTPRAPEMPVTVVAGQQTWTDPYAYLADETHAATQAYLSAEREYFNKQTAEFDDLRRELAAQLNLALPLTRRTRPVTLDGFVVFAEVPQGRQYPVFRRHPEGAPDRTETILDVNQLAEGQRFLSLGGFAVQNALRLVAFTVDLDGSQQYQLNIRSLNGDTLPVSLSVVDSDLAWQGDRLIFIRQGCVYSLELQDGQTQRLHCRRSEVFQLGLMSIGQAVAVVARAPDTTDVTLITADGSIVPFTPFKAGHRYSLIRHNDADYVLTNWRTKDFELARATPGELPDNWQFMPLPGEGQLLDVEFAGQSIALQRRHEMGDVIYLDSGVVIARAGEGESLQLRRAPSATQLEYVRSGYLVPDEYIVVDLASGYQSVAMAAPMPATFNAAHYVVERRWYSVGGVRVPVTLVYRQGEPLADRALWLRVYGAYGLSMPTGFDATRLPLLDRGVILGFVHVRGGGALGSVWHELGRGPNKEQSFDDFIGVTEGLIKDGVGDPARIVASGVSAGATIIAVAANRRPDLYRAMVARVPFVDLLNSLRDETQLLTASDTLEWGDPLAPKDFEVLSRYSPYDNVKAQRYPAMLITAAENDVRVPAHEALKWMARLRANHSGDQPLLLEYLESEGHLGATDQYDRRQSQALEYAFVLRVLALD